MRVADPASRRLGKLEVMHREGGVNNIQEVKEMTNYREILRLLSQAKESIREVIRKLRLLKNHRQIDNRPCREIPSCVADSTGNDG